MSVVDAATINEEMRRKLNDEQWEIAHRFDKPLFVAAGAGSGKTHTLTQRVIYGIVNGYIDSVENILVITFTKKAASEIKERIRGELIRVGLKEEALKVDGAWVSTIHSMCSRMLKESAFEVGIDPDFSVIDETQADECANRAIVNVIRRFQNRGECDELLHAYKLFSAGGSMGGDYSLFSLIKSYIQAAALAPYELDSLCAVPSPEHFDTEFLAAQEREETEAKRAEWNKLALLNKQFEEIARASYHAFKQAKREELQGMDNNDLLAETLRVLRTNEEIRRRYQKLFQFIMVDEYQDTAKQQVEIIELLIEKTNEKKLVTVGDAQQSIYRFRGADVGVFNEGQARCATTDPDSLKILNTNYRSHKDILRFVMQVCDGANGCGIIPDFPASSDLKAKEDVPNSEIAEAARRAHTENYALSFVPRGFTKSSAGEEQEDRNREAAAGQEKISRPVFETSKDAAGSPQSAQVPGPRVFVDVAAGGDSETGKTCLAQAMARRFAWFHAQGQDYRDMALLVSSNVGMARYVQAFRDEGVPCVISGGSSFASAREVKVFDALLHTIVFPYDTEQGLFPLLSSGMFGFSKEDFIFLRTFRKKEQESCGQERVHRATAGLADYFFAETDGAAEACLSIQLQQARTILTEAWQKLSKHPLSSIARDALFASGWIERLSEEGIEGQAAIANIMEALRSLIDLERNRGTGPIACLNSFDTWLSKVRKGPSSLSGNSQDAVSVMTIHASKGLQFRVVGIAESCSEPSASKSFLRMNTFGSFVFWCLGIKELKDEKESVARAEEIDREAVTRFLEQHKAAVGTVPDVADFSDAFQHEFGLFTYDDWRAFLKHYDKKEEEAEAARKLYVALTRAEEALVLNMHIATTALKPGNDSFAARVFRAIVSEGRADGVQDEVVHDMQYTKEFLDKEALKKLGDKDPLVHYLEGPLQCVPFTFGGKEKGQAPLLLNVLIPGAEEELKVPEGEQQELLRGAQEDVSRITPMASGEAEQASTKSLPGVLFSAVRDSVSGEDLESTQNALPDTAQEAASKRIIILNKQADWYSYTKMSSVQKKKSRMDRAASQQLSKRNERDELLVAAKQEDTTEPEATETVSTGAIEAETPRLSPSEATGESTVPSLSAGSSKENAATQFGTAFHLCAQYLIESGRMPSDERISAVARMCGMQLSPAGQGKDSEAALSGKLYDDLYQAIHRWAQAALFDELMSYVRVRCEVPFVVKEPSVYGAYLQGAIDVLADNNSFEKAWVVDYKTGDLDCKGNEALFAKRHEQQARVYAHVLFRMGYTQVSCTFVAVQLEERSGSGNPLHTTYHYSEDPGIE